MDNAAVVIEFLLRASAQVQAYAALLHRSRSEGRDVSAAELDEIKASYRTERDELQALADAKRNER